MTNRLGRLLCFAATISATSVHATEWQVLGARAAAMGGAGVALPSGPESAYWNPAGLGQADNPSGFQLPFGAHIAISGAVIQGANDANKVAKDCGTIPVGPLCTQANITNALNELNNPGNGARGDLGVGAGLKLGRLAFFVNNLSWAGAKPMANFSNNAPGTFSSNQSSLILTGINATEFGVAYGHELPFLSGIFGGAAVKGIVGRVGYDQFTVANNNFGGSGFKDFTKNVSSSFQPGLDVGGLWDLNRTFNDSLWWRPRVGVTAHDLNNPRFKQPAAATNAGVTNKYSLQGNVRAGLSLQLLKFWNLAADADLTRNLTALDGVKSQMIGAGTEINVFDRPWLNIPLRAGLAKNAADPGSKTTLTAGFGLNFLHVNLELGAALTPSNQTIQSQGSTKKIPSELSLSGQFSVLFGGD